MILINLLILSIGGLGLGILVGILGIGGGIVMVFLLVVLGY